jgi:hypothetical protein
MEFCFFPNKSKVVQLYLFLDVCQEKRSEFRIDNSGQRITSVCQPERTMGVLSERSGELFSSFSDEEGAEGKECYCGRLRDKNDIVISDQFAIFIGAIIIVAWREFCAE